MRVRGFIVARHTPKNQEQTWSAFRRQLLPIILPMSVRIKCIALLTCPLMLPPVMFRTCPFLIIAIAS